MELRQLTIGTVVRVKEGHRKPELEGKVGIIDNVWGGPSYRALDVRLDDGRSELFWSHEVDVAGARPVQRWDSARMAYYDGS